MGSSILLLVTAYVALHSCGDPDTGPEICDNGSDDDNDGFPDCMDIDCMGHPTCDPTTDGDADADADEEIDGDSGDGGDADADGDSDGDSDGDGDTDADGDADSDADADADSDADGDADGDSSDADVPVRECELDGGMCVWDCATSEDCVIALDMMSCCGGHPHEGETPDELIVCPTAVHRDRLEEDICVIPWSPDDPIPEVPRACAPFCEGMVCGPCRPPSRTVCSDSRCMGIASGGCVTDRDCSGGASCVDPDGDGFGECRAGSHECANDEECAAAHPECDGCRCMDTDVDGFRDCSCWGCPAGDCSTDGQCEPHEFCVGSRCVFAGEDACRIGLWDCEDGFVCEPSEGNPSRGTCVPIETDGGLSDGG